jgi:hypothetical protein
MKTLTVNEIAVLKAIADSEYGKGEASTASIWTFSVWDNIDRKVVPTRKSLGGIVASLNEKGLVSSYEAGKDSTVRLTDAGVVVYKTVQHPCAVHTGTNCVCEDPRS